MTYHTHHLTLSPEDNKRLINLCGHHEEHLQLIAERLQVTIKRHGYTFSLQGPAAAARAAEKALQELYVATKKEAMLTPEQVHLYLQTMTKKQGIMENSSGISVDLPIKRHGISARGERQAAYVKNILTHDINFGIGPAGTGKTYLAVACAVSALEQERVSRIVLTRPIVEAGERLGFLPGDLAQKVHPYLRPLYDALFELMGFDQVNRLLERDVIELAPLAFMRGRSLNDSFIILDEGQNTTVEQMKMFLTRIGFRSKVVVTGDVTQIDLANRRDSGLVQTLEVLDGVKGISFTQFQANDVVRHSLVQSIVEAYERYEGKTQPKEASKNGKPRE